MITSSLCGRSVSHHVSSAFRMCIMFTEVLVICWDYFTERNEHLETRNSCVITSSLHSLNSTNCIPLDRARRALHAGTLFAGILAAGKNWLRFLRNRVGGSSRMANFSRNSNTNYHVPTIWLPACRTRRALSIGVQFVEIRHCSEDVHSRSVFSSVPFRSVK